MTASDLHEHQTHTWCTYVHANKTYTFKTTLTEEVTDTGRTLATFRRVAMSEVQAGPTGYDPVTMPCVPDAGLFASSLHSQL